MTVVVNYRQNEEAANDTVAEIARAGGQATAIKADVRDAEQVKVMFAQVKDTF